MHDKHHEKLWKKIGDVCQINTKVTSYDRKSICIYSVLIYTVFILLRVYYFDPLYYNVNFTTPSRNSGGIVVGRCSNLMFYNE